MQEPKYPAVKVRLGNLRGPEGNAFVILGRVSSALRQAGVPASDVEAFNQEATAGDYDALLATVRRWVKAA